MLAFLLISKHEIVKYIKLEICYFVKYIMIYIAIVYRYIMCSNPADLREMAKWDGKGHASRGKLMEKLQGRLLLAPSSSYPQTTRRQQHKDLIYR